MTLGETTSPNRHLGYVLKRFPRISETFVAAELIEMVRQGERVTVFAVSRPSEPFTHGFLDDLDAPVVYLPYRPSRQPVRVARALARALKADPRGWLRAAATALWPPRRKGGRRLLQATVLRDEMARRGVDHAHAHFASTAARLANLAWRMGGPSYSVTAHGKDIWHRQVRPDRIRDKLGPATFVATVSTPNCEYLASLLGPTAKVSVVHNSVDVRRLMRVPTGDPEPGRVVTVARLVEKKGIGDLVSACGRLHEEGRPVRLTVVGDGPERATLERQAARLGLAATFCGLLPYERVMEHYRRASVFCLPCIVASTGDRDGLPTAVLEAMALGVPVVTTGVNGLAEVVIPETTGLVVPQRDPGALAAALARLLDDAELAVRLAAAARDQVEEHFSLERSVAQLRTLFDAAITRPVPAAARGAQPSGRLAS